MGMSRICAEYPDPERADRPQATDVLVRKDPEEEEDEEEDDEADDDEKKDDEGYSE